MPTTHHPDQSKAFAIAATKASTASNVTTALRGDDRQAAATSGFCHATIIACRAKTAHSSATRLQSVDVRPLIG
jgi:hypothetical protein